MGVGGGGDNSHGFRGCVWLRVGGLHRQGGG